MSRRRLLLGLSLLLAVALALAGGLAYWLSRDGDAGEAPVQATGPDTGAEVQAVGNAGYIPGPDETFPSAEWLEALRAALEAEFHAQEEARLAAEAYAAARAQDEAVAAAAIRAWGRGQLLLAIPTIGITAAVSAIGFEPGTRTPAIPQTPWGVGWYNFTDFPGTAGNAVFSGHVDWYTGAPAVFGRLQQVGLGDTIYMVLADGTPIAYVVERKEWVTPYTADVGEIFGITAREAITFITCGGAWDPVAKDYSHRLILRAFRVR